MMHIIIIINIINIIMSLIVTADKKQIKKQAEEKISITMFIRAIRVGRSKP